jgi:hypothetical protein
VAGRLQRSDLLPRCPFGLGLPPCSEDVRVRAYGKYARLFRVAADSSDDGVVVVHLEAADMPPAPPAAEVGLPGCGVDVVVRTDCKDVEVVAGARDGGDGRAWLGTRVFAKSRQRERLKYSDSAVNSPREQIKSSFLSTGLRLKAALKSILEHPLHRAFGLPLLASGETNFADNVGDLSSLGVPSCWRLDGVLFGACVSSLLFLFDGMLF